MKHSLSVTSYVEWKHSFDKKSLNLAVVLPSPAPIISVQPSLHKVSAVTADGEVWDLKKYQRLDLNPIKCVKAISWTQHAMMIATDMGTVYASGYDNWKTGILGMGKIFKQNEPVLVEGLADIQHLAIWETHGAAVDRTGSLFTWGTENLGELGGTTLSKARQTPQRVESASIFVANNVIVQKGYTAIQTKGGFLYIYGTIPNPCKKKKLRTSSPNLRRGHHSVVVNAPYTLKELEMHFITQICGNTQFLVALADSGMAFTFDGFCELVRLPVLGDAVLTAIAWSGNVIVGLEGRRLYQWSERTIPVRINRQARQGESKCPLLSWYGRVYRLNDNVQDVKIINNQKHAISAICATDLEKEENFAEYEGLAEPYGRNKLTQQLRKNLNSSPQSPTKSTLPRIISLRIEHEQRSRLVRALAPISSLLRSSFSKIRNYGMVKSLYRRAAAIMLMPSTVATICSRICFTNLALAFNIIKEHRNDSTYNSSGLDDFTIDPIPIPEEVPKIKLSLVDSLNQKLNNVKAPTSKLIQKRPAFKVGGPGANTLNVIPQKRQSQYIETLNVRRSTQLQTSPGRMSQLVTGRSTGSLIRKSTLNIPTIEESFSSEENTQITSEKIKQGLLHLSPIFIRLLNRAFSYPWKLIWRLQEDQSKELENVWKNKVFSMGWSILRRLSSKVKKKQKLEAFNILCN